MRKKNLENQILHEVIEKYGEEKQMRLAQEECGELIQAVNKYFRAMEVEPRNRKHAVERARKHLVEEIADVSIMLDQMRMLIDENHDEMKAEKMARLADNLNKQRKKRGAKK